MSPARVATRNGHPFSVMSLIFCSVSATVRGTDTGIWRRLRLVPFTVRIPDERKDTALAGKLLAELPGILNWALAGCLEWQRRGLVAPECVRTATEDYRHEEDVVGQFLEDCTEPQTGEGVRNGAGTVVEAIYLGSGVRLVIDLDDGPRVSVLEQNVRGRVHDDEHGDRVVVSWHDGDVVAVDGTPVGPQNPTPTAAFGAMLPGTAG